MLFEPGWMGWEDGPRSGKGPGWEFDSAHPTGWEDGPGPSWKTNFRLKVPFRRGGSNPPAAVHRTCLLPYRFPNVPKNRKPAVCSQRAPVENYAPTYSPTCYGNTIGSGGLNCSVRNGKRWTPPI